jgi:L-asparaginase II
VVATAVLQRLGILDADLPEALRPFARLPLRNWAGTTVGETAPEPDALSALAF